MDRSDEKVIMKVDDPRDEFIIMLLERIEYLEDRLNKFIEPKLDYLNEERLRFECDNASVQSKTSSKTFKIKLYHHSNNLEVIKTLCEKTINEILERLGSQSFLSMTAVIDTTSDYAIIYLNMRRRCWVYETIKSISNISIACLMKIEKDICYAYNSHIGIDAIAKGYIYNAYDLNGVKIDTPCWNQW